EDATIDLILQAAANLSTDPIEINWYAMASAALAIRGIERQYGLDAQLEALYGVDGGATWACDWAYQEGSWDAFHELPSLPWVGFMAELVPGLTQIRSYTASGVWITGNGPLSTGIDAGYAEFAPKPAVFYPPSDAITPEIMERFGLDDFTIATVGGNIPWYDPYSPYM